MQTWRKDRLSSEIVRQTGMILMQELRDPRLGFMTVTRVKVSDDYKYAKIFVSIMGSKKQKKLGLSGKEVTVGEVVNGLWKKAGFPNPLPAQVTSNTHSLGRAMLGPQGIIAVLRKQAGPLKKAGIDFSPKLETELKELAERMVASAAAHPQQHYHELRVTPLELNQALAAFSTFIP